MSKRKREDTPNNIHTQGYHIFRNSLNLTKDVEDELLKLSKNMSGAIFNTNQNNDRKRRQKYLNQKNKNIQKFKCDMNNFIKENISDTLTPNSWVILKSLKNCKRQLAHTDYAPSIEMEEAANEDYPLLMLVALMDNTTLDVWSNSINIITSSESELKKRKKIKRTTVKLDKGDILVFRADFVHAGSGYEDENVRLHCFLDSDKIFRHHGDTFRMDKAHPSIANLIEDN
jgi:hypothetical protein